MKKLRKYLYLFQLEEYNTNRFLCWLNKDSIDKLFENKGKLKFTLRIKLTIFFSLPFLWLGYKTALVCSNFIVSAVFKILGVLVISLSRIKLASYSSLTKIVVTGSYGKTTFKDKLAWVIAGKYKVLSTPGNINTPLGIAFFLLKKLNRKHEVLVVEAAAYSRGEIKKIGNLIEPHYGIVTIYGWMHLERFESFENIKLAKNELVPFIKDRNKLYLPQEDHMFVDLEEVVSRIARQLGIGEALVKKRLRTFQNPEHRLQIKKINKDILLIDDSYNSNPLGFRKALVVLKKYRNYQRVVVTPGMIELGQKQYELNKGMARETAKVADILVIVGETNKRALEKGARGIKKLIFISKDQGYDDILQKYLRPPTVILLENDLPDHYF